MIKNLFVFVMFFFVGLIATDLYAIDDDYPEFKEPRKVCFRLQFSAGDTLKYKVVSRDSIVIDYGSPLIKDREEVIRIICDSVDREGNFHLMYSLIDFSSKEYYQHEKVERNNSEWLNRRVVFVIDSLGRRLSVRNLDTSRAGLSPGGAFQPYLFFDFGYACKNVNESWIIDALDDLTENGIPIPVLEYTALFRAKAPIDTLGELCNRFEFIRSGQGSMYAPEKDGYIRVTNIIHSFGAMDISTNNRIPVHLYQTIEQKLSIHLSPNQVKPGSHYITSKFTLLERRTALGKR